ncbi:hypothetical protein BC628DRAFT_836704 [Trametes gibbosa]|nr:hypothetical protein BC628DRAFT_836704 [Trametes gibbosa]
MRDARCGQRRYRGSCVALSSSVLDKVKSAFLGGELLRPPPLGEGAGLAQRNRFLCCLCGAPRSIITTQMKAADRAVTSSVRSQGDLLNGQEWHLPMLVRGKCPHLGAGIEQAAIQFLTTNPKDRRRRLEHSSELLWDAASAVNATDAALGSCQSRPCA